MKFVRRAGSVGLVLTTLLSSSSGFADAVPNTRLGVKFGLLGRSMAFEQEQAQGVGFNLGFDLSARPVSPLELIVSGGIDSTTGYQQTRYRDIIPQSGPYISEATLSVTPLSWLSISGGAVSAAGVRQPLLLSSGRAFPGLAQQLAWANDEKTLLFSVRAQQGVLTSRTLAPAASEADRTPHFFAETVRGQWKPLSSVLVTVGVGRFDFRDLTSTQAIDGSFSGNTTVSAGPGLDRFRFSYSGWSAEAGLEAKLGRWIVASNTKMLQNLRADPGYRNAQSVGLEIQRWLSPALRGGARAEAFFAESDAAPGGLMSARYVSLNRSGWMAETFATWPDSATRLSLWYQQTELLAPSALQSGSRAFVVSFETALRAL